MIYITGIIYLTECDTCGILVTLRKKIQQKINYDHLFYSQQKGYINFQNIVPYMGADKLVEQLSASPLSLTTSRSLKVMGCELPQIQKTSVPKHTAHGQIERNYISRSKHWDEANHGWVWCTTWTIKTENPFTAYKTPAHRCKASLTLFITVAITMFKRLARTNNKNKVNKTYQDINAPSWTNISWQEEARAKITNQQTFKTVRYSCIWRGLR